MYCGCVTDQEFKLAICELYPNRKYYHPDAGKRRAMRNEKIDLQEFQLKAQEYQARRYYAS